MTFWNKLDAFIKKNTFSELDYNNTKKVLSYYLKDEAGRCTWSQLTLNMQELLIEFERESGVKGLIPKGAKLNPCLYL